MEQNIHSKHINNNRHFITNSKGLIENNFGNGFKKQQISLFNIKTPSKYPNKNSNALRDLIKSQENFKKNFLSKIMKCNKQSQKKYF